MGGPTYVTREAETGFAMKVAGVEWEQWPFPDVDPPWGDVADRMTEFIQEHQPDTLIFPVHEEGGHDQHNEVSRIARYFRSFTHLCYFTYVRGHGRTDHATRIIPTPEEEAMKRQALACYASQAAFPPTAPWFGDDQREFVL